jgi:hypothetical protein
MSRCLSEEERAPLLDGAAKYLRRLGLDDFDLEVVLTAACHLAGFRRGRGGSDPPESLR